MILAWDLLQQFSYVYISKSKVLDINEQVTRPNRGSNAKWNETHLQQLSQVKI